VQRLILSFTADGNGCTDDTVAKQHTMPVKYCGQEANLPCPGIDFAYNICVFVNLAQIPRRDEPHAACTPIIYAGRKAARNS
jgi:hypothetical protein